MDRSSLSFGLLYFSTLIVFLYLSFPSIALYPPPTLTASPKYRTFGRRYSTGFWISHGSVFCSKVHQLAEGAGTESKP